MRPNPVSNPDSHEGREEAESSLQALPRLRTSLHLAQEVGEGLGEGEVLQ